MRTTFEIIDAARLGEPCTDMELRCCIMAMHCWESMAQNMLLGLEKKIGSPNANVRAIGLVQVGDHVGYRLKGFARPVDEYIGPNRIPGSEAVIEGARFANKVVAAAAKKNGWGKTE